MFNTKIRVNFYDCDPAGILFFANLFKFAHTAYEQMMESFKMSINFFDDDKYVLPILSAESKFIKPIKAGENIEISISVSILKKSSFELSYSFKNEDELLAEVKTVHVCVDKREFSKIEIPAELHNSLESNQK
jgi:YbgC/YbaW family acyl-CoA thioester hydrolase